jgi:UDPglucose 6-dehydrogenase
MTNKKLSVIGLGKLGIPLAACFASKGFQVVGVDVDPLKVEAINEGRAPVCEPGLQEMLTVVQERLTATLDVEAAVSASKVTFIVVPTPSEPEGGFSLRCVLPACEAIGRVLRTKSGYHLVVLTSTVMPGSTGGPVRSTLERVSGKSCGQGFGLCFSPEFIALGSVIQDFLNPEFVLIGESDSRSGEILEAIYKDLCENDPPVARMSFINAELAKLAVNTFVTTKITFANTLARICERLPEADVDVVTAVLGLDSRIGRKYLKGAIGYGGPCFPRDNVALVTLARRIGVPAILAEATDRANREEVHRLATLVKSKIPPGGTVGILGLAYKPKTDVVEESQGLLLAQTLLSKSIPVVAYDPAAMSNARQMLNGPISFFESPEACVQAADVVVITTPWEVFECLDPGLLERRSKPRTLIDCWRVLEQERVKAVVDYVALGKGPQTLEEPSRSSE